MTGGESGMTGGESGMTGGESGMTGGESGMTGGGIEDDSRRMSRMTAGAGGPSYGLAV